MRAHTGMLTAGTTWCIEYAWITSCDAMKPNSTTMNPRKKITAP